MMTFSSNSSSESSTSKSLLLLFLQFPLTSLEERENAGLYDLWMAVEEIICVNGNERHQYEEALIAIIVEEPLRRYCQRIRRPDFWGGEAELSRPAPPLPHLHLSEEMVNEAATFIRECANAVLSASEDIALGRNSRMFIKVGLCLFIISVVVGLIDFLALGYTSLILGLTVPALYERYERHIVTCSSWIQETAGVVYKI
ncbi:reticulon-like protein B12 isoform X2 [Primulina tabacum]|uniref:reticulon-like protein B12 isoform X2 n=1 Tax=Primulina tabacum TaxID=48773 RepID=UPI003F5AD82C